MGKLKVFNCWWLGRGGVRSGAEYFFVLSTAINKYKYFLYQKPRLRFIKVKNSSILVFDCYFYKEKLGASKKGGIMVAVHNGLDLTVYRYLWWPICPNWYVHFYSYKMDISVVGITVPKYSHNRYFHIYKWGYRSIYIGFGYFNPLVLPNHPLVLP
jgi:hypothetical protein